MFSLKGFKERLKPGRFNSVIVGEKDLHIKIVSHLAPSLRGGIPDKAEAISEIPEIASSPLRDSSQ